MRSNRQSNRHFEILKPLAFWKLDLLFKHLKWLKSRIIHLVQRFRLESSVSNRIRVITNKIQTKIRQRIKYKWFVDVCFTNTPNNNILHWKVLRLLCSCKRLITFWKPLKTIVVDVRYVLYIAPHFAFWHVNFVGSYSSFHDLLAISAIFHHQV